ncbi:hypothetical protein GPJ56_010154 [Histomonas meleagridis]|uniref:uncharacterized protein n=1 Tax=Histomonas meleagridis TaxID=135588 RepID=UPI00355A9B06|nr:hypothetical protein GPJ56_010154 [Histomonas meleagridis]KAH0804690.1 hypothetical protein GO595_002384 [Histomonas meleagridis]
MTKKEEMNDHSFDIAIKALVKRDFFPDLKQDHQDETINKYDLNSFCNTYISKSDAKFVNSIENDRKLLRSSAPKPIYPLNVDDSKMNPWPHPQYNALFYEPPTINSNKHNAITYNKTRKVPSIRFSQTRLPDEASSSFFKDFPAYHPFTTESSTTESESEFEGRSQYSAYAIKAYQNSSKQIRRDRLEKRKKRNELSSRGLDLLKTLESKD